MRSGIEDREHFVRNTLSGSVRPQEHHRPDMMIKSPADLAQFFRRHPEFAVRTSPRQSADQNPILAQENYLARNRLIEFLAQTDALIPTEVIEQIPGGQRIVLRQRLQFGKQIRELHALSGMIAQPAEICRRCGNARDKLFDRCPEASSNMPIPRQADGQDYRRHAQPDGQVIPDSGNNLSSVNRGSERFACCQRQQQSTDTENVESGKFRLALTIHIQFFHLGFFIENMSNPTRILMREYSQSRFP